MGGPGQKHTQTGTQMDKTGTQMDENRGTNRHGKGYGMDMDYFYRQHKKNVVSVVLINSTKLSFKR
jgi:hypothetical protein